MVLKFVDRAAELDFLEEKYRERTANFILIYGRRRIGKTELVKQFINEKKAFYFMARKEPMSLEISRLVHNFNRKFSIFIEADTLEEFFSSIKKMGKLVVIIDEFSYWIEEDKSVASTFQYLWDEILKDSQIFLILLGSSISTMESLTSYKNPLYGRKTGQIKLGTVDFFYLKQRFNYTWEELVKVYGCIGGIPAYFQYFNDEISVGENIERNFFNRMSILYEDAERLLKDELREPVTYLNILTAINSGKTKLSGISAMSGVSVTNVPKYLKKLETLELIEKEFPIDSPANSRRGVYKIKDFYYKFWLRFVYPYRDEIEIGTLQFSHFTEEFNRYLGKVYESIAKQFIIWSVKKGLFPINLTRTGRWWFKDREIDVVAMKDKRTGAFFEVKWKELSRRDTEKILKNLQELSQEVRIPFRKKYYGVIAKHIQGKEALREQNFLVYDLRDFDSIIKNN